MHAPDFLTGCAPRRARALSRPLIPIIVPMVLWAILIVLLVLSRPATAEDVTWGNKGVFVDESYDNLTLVLDGNLTVSAHTDLTITNSTITVNASSAEEYWILVEDTGTLELRSVNVQANGGTYALYVAGTLIMDDGELKDLPESTGEEDHMSGLRLLAGGNANLRDVDIDNLFGRALSVQVGAFVNVDGGILSGSSTVIWVQGGSVTLEGTEVIASQGRALVDMSPLEGESGGFWAENCSFITTSVVDAGTPSVVVRIDGLWDVARLDRCSVGTPELAEVRNGTFLMINGTFSRTMGRSFPDILCHRALVEITGVEVGEVDVLDGDLTIVGSTYESGSVRGVSVVVSVGPVPPFSTLSENVSLQHHYWVDFQLLNETGVPEEDLDLWVERADGVLILDTRSGENGWVRHIPMRSWTRMGAVFTYEPSHSVNFGLTDYQITQAQVYDNTTITLWNSIHSRDLVLDSDSMELTAPAPRANITFGIIIDGQSLVPHAYQSGEVFMDLLVDGQVHTRITTVVSSQADRMFDGIQLTQGRHLLQVQIDPVGVVDEMNEGGNNLVSLLIDVSAGPNGGGDLVDLQVEIRLLRDAQGNEGDLILDGVIEIHYTVRAMNAQTRLRNVDLELLVGGVVRESVTIDIVDMEGQQYRHVGVLTINLPRGDYSIRLRVDPDNTITEEFELNNEDSVDVTLDPNVGETDFWDPACCSAVLLVSLIVVVGALGAYANKRQRDATSGGDAITDTVQYTPSSIPRPTAYSQRQPSQPAGYQYSGQPRPTQPRAPPAKIEDRWTAQRLDPELARRYRVDGSDLQGAERIVVNRPQPPPPSQQRYEVDNVACPRCGQGEIVGFADGSAKCQSCKKIFYPGRQ